MNPDLAYNSLLNAAGALAQLVVIALLLERALAFVYEYHWFKWVSDRIDGIKAPIALIVSTVACSMYRFDVLAQLFHQSDAAARPSRLGIVLTAAIIAGGSGGAIALFQGVLNWSKGSRDELIRAKQTAATAAANEALARDTAARALTAESEARRVRAETELATLGRIAGPKTTALERPAAESTASPDYDRRGSSRVG